LSPRGDLVRHTREAQAAGSGPRQGNTRERSTPVANFLFVYRHGTENHMQMSPEEMQQHMQKWHTWLKQGFEKGWLVNPGDGLKKEGRVVNSKKVVTDGPFVEAKEIVGGFTIVQANTLAAAAEIAKGCPCLLTGGKVEVRPLEGFVIEP
jgi:hypothetical protein